LPPGLLRGLLGVEPAQLPLLHLLHLCRGAGGALPLLTGALHHDWPEVERGIAGLVAEVEGRGVRLLTGQMVTAVEQGSGGVCMITAEGRILRSKLLVICINPR